MDLDSSATVIRPQQLAFVSRRSVGQEDGDPHHPIVLARIPFEHGVDQHWDALPVGAHDLERDRSCGRLHLQQRHVVGLVVQLPSDRQQIDEPANARRRSSCR